MSKAKKQDKAKDKPKGQSFQGQPFIPDVGLIIAVFEAGREVVVVRVNDYKKRKTLDVRRFWDNDGVWSPSRQGASIAAEDVPTLLDKLSKDGKKILAAVGADA